MKSVVVQASTITKAIESAWIKAGKPEEFFIRILQEPTFGFLGFGGKKAKVAFFFKNSPKLETLFPVVLKQKEYSNFFDNASIKNPSTMDVIDADLNKNVALHQDKKNFKQHNNRPKNQKPQQNLQPVSAPKQHEVKTSSSEAALPKVQHNNKPKQAQPQHAAKKTTPEQSAQLHTKQPVHKEMVKSVEKKTEIAKTVTNVLKAVQVKKEEVKNIEKKAVEQKVMQTPRVPQVMKRRPLQGETVSGISKVEKIESKS